MATQLTGLLNHRRQRAERAEDAEAASRRRQEEFELAHLVELNGLLHEYVGTLPPLAGALRTYWARAQELTVTERDAAFPHEAMTATTAAARAVRSQIGFILPGEARQRVTEAYEAVDLASADLLLNDEGPDFGVMGTQMNKAYEALSARVREIYAGQANRSTGRTLATPSTRRA
ncbi:hypothetical protein [Streptomyces brevispora]|uniref:hypothetical protein n=1 Tax=Streptomyces brevispora TaxID=887462 RepID=UPI0035D8B66B